MWGLGEGVSEKPTSCLSDFRVSSTLVVPLTVPFSSLLLQELSMCLQPVLLGLCISEALMYHFCLPRGRHLDICYLLCLHSFLGSQLILLYFAITQWSKGDIRGAMRKAVGGGGRKDAQMVLRVLNDWIMLGILYRGD